MAPTDSLSAQQVQAFRRDGFLVIPGFYDLAEDIEPIQRHAYRLIGQVMKRHGVPDTRRPYAPEHFDDGYVDLIRQQRSYGAEVYDAVKQIPAFVRLLGCPSHERLFQQLRGPDAIVGIAGGGSGIRIDNPSEERFRAPWHQEYPAQLRSIDGIVYWSPLVEVTPDLGPVRFCVGSHVEGPVPVHRHDPKHPEKTGAYGLTLQDEEGRTARYPQVAPLSRPGDLVIIDFMTLHASGYNVGQRSRWSMQFRYFNFNEPTGMQHGWKGSYAMGVDFATVHPELCVE